jgi:hypothetical protein
MQTLVFNRRLSAVLIIVFRNLGYTSRFPERKLGWSNTGLVVKTYSICQDRRLRGRNEEGIDTVHSAGKSWTSCFDRETKIDCIHERLLLYPNFLSGLQDNGTATFNPVMLLN